MQAIVPSLEVTGGGGGDLEEVVEQLASELFTALGSTLLSCQRDPTLLYTGTCPAAAAAAAAYSHTHLPGKSEKVSELQRSEKSQDILIEVRENIGTLKQEYYCTVAIF